MLLSLIHINNSGNDNNWFISPGDVNLSLLSQGNFCSDDNSKL